MLISLFADERTLTALLCTGPAVGNFRKKDNHNWPPQAVIKEVNQDEWQH